MSIFLFPAKNPNTPLDLGTEFAKLVISVPASVAVSTSLESILFFTVSEKSTNPSANFLSFPPNLSTSLFPAKNPNTPLEFGTESANLVMSVPALVAVSTDLESYLLT